MYFMACTTIQLGAHRVNEPFTRIVISNIKHIHIQSNKFITTLSVNQNNSREQLHWYYLVNKRQYPQINVGCYKTYCRIVLKLYYNMSEIIYFIILGIRVTSYCNNFFLWNISSLLILSKSIILLNLHISHFPDIYKQGNISLQFYHVWSKY